MNYLKAINSVPNPDCSSKIDQYSEQDSGVTDRFVLKVLTEIATEENCVALGKHLSQLLAVLGVQSAVYTPVNRKSGEDWQTRVLFTQSAAPDRKRGSLEPGGEGKKSQNIAFQSSAPDVIMTIGVPVVGVDSRAGIVNFALGTSTTLADLKIDKLLNLIAQVVVYAYGMIERRRAEAEQNLSPREIDVLREVSSGSNNIQIAKSLGISQHTVDGYLRRIYLKLGVTDRTTAVVKGIASGAI